MLWLLAGPTLMHHSTDHFPEKLTSISHRISRPQTILSQGDVVIFFHELYDKHKIKT